MTNQILEHSDNEDFSLLLPLKKRDLGSFISSLLGQQQSIDRVLTAKFDIDHAWLINLHELIDQRIRQQQSANMVEFTAIIHFNNGLTRTISTTDAFKHYVETKKETAIAITLIWNYLIKFPGRNHPEKQEIAFNARVKNDENEGEEKDRFSFLLGGYGSKEAFSFIGFNIEHTERTWGDDIESIMSKHVETAIRSEKGLSETVYSCFRWGLAFGIFIFCLLFPLYIMVNGHVQGIEEIMVQYHAIDASLEPINIVSEKLDKIAELLANNEKKGTPHISFALVFAAPFLFGFVLRLTKKNLNSFIVLSPADSTRRDDLLKKEKRGMKIMGGSYLLALVIGVAGNYIYSLLVGLF